MATFFSESSLSFSQSHVPVCIYTCILLHIFVCPEGNTVKQDVLHTLTFLPLATSVVLTPFMEEHGCSKVFLYEDQKEVFQKTMSQRGKEVKLGRHQSFFVVHVGSHVNP